MNQNGYGPGAQAHHRFIFGGNTGLTQSDLQRKRQALQGLAYSNTRRAPANAGEGLNAIGKALAWRMGNADVQEQEQAGQQEYSALQQVFMDKLKSGEMGGQPGGLNPAQHQAATQLRGVPDPKQPPAQAGGGYDLQSAIMEASGLAANPFASPGQRAQLTALQQLMMQRYGLDQKAQQATAQRQADREDWQWKQDYLRNNQPAPSMQIKKLADGRMYHVDPTGQQAPRLVHPDMDTSQIASGTEYGLNPQYGVDANGNPVMVQVGKNGTATQTRMPEGVTLSKEPIRLDAGTHFVLLDPITRQPVGKIEKNVAGTASARAVGKAQGEAQVELPRAMDAADQTIALIDKAISHPGLNSAVGGILDLGGGYMPEYMLGDDGRNFLAMHNQLVGKSFLEGLGQLRGSGAISEIEGQKAQNAVARLSRSQTVEGYQEALRELRGIIALGRQRSQQTAGVTPTQVPGANAGEISDEELLKLYGQ